MTDPVSEPLRLFVNLDRHPERRRGIEARLARLGLDFRRVAAVDGPALAPDELARLEAPLTARARDFYPRSLTPGEIGCFLSHRRCWRELLESEANWALILEDDALPSERAGRYMRSVDWLPDGVDVCQLYGPERARYRVRRGRLPAPDGELLRPIRPTPTGTVAYLISRRAARWALEQSAPCPAPVDEFLFNIEGGFARRFPTWRLDPCCVTHDYRHASTARDGRVKRSGGPALRLKKFCLSAARALLAASCPSAELHYE